MTTLPRSSHHLLSFAIALGIWFATQFFHPLLAQINVATYACTGAPGLAEGTLLDAQIYQPFSMCRDAAGNIYFADATNHCIRKMTRDSVLIFAGTGIAGFKDTLAAYAQFKSPAGVAVDDSGNVYVADFENFMIRKISADGWVTTIAGTGALGYVDGPAASSSFRYPRGIAVDGAGNVYVGDSWNHRIRKISGGAVSTYAGSSLAVGVGSVGGYEDGADSISKFYTPCGLALDDAGNLYVADAYNHRIRKITPDGTVSTYAGTGATGPSAGGFVDGPFGTAMLDTPTECWWNSAGNTLFFTDTFNHAIRRVDVAGDVTTLAGTGMSGFDNGPGSSATFDFPRGLASNDAGDSIWVCDYNNNVIRVVSGDLLASKSDPHSNARLVLYPQPASDLLELDWEGAVHCSQWEVRSLTGAVVRSGETCSSHFGLDVASLPSGQYLLRIQGGDRVSCKQFVIQH